MLFKERFIDDIRRGAISVTFRRWKTPRVRAGGTYRIRPDVVIRVDAIRSIEPSSISERDAKRAGFDSKAELVAQLRAPGTLYRIDFATEDHAPDPRQSLGRTSLDDEGLRGLTKQLDAMDARTSTGAWTRRALSLIAEQPGRRAGDLAREMDLDTPTFKTRVRRLKALGLTASLTTGYALTPRGRDFLGRS